MDGLTDAVETLLEAWFATDDKKYSVRITHLIRVFFLDEATRMSPSLTYGQSIPGICNGRGIGIIETVKLINLIDTVVHLQQLQLNGARHHRTTYKPPRHRSLELLRPRQAVNPRRV